MDRHPHCLASPHFTAVAANSNVDVKAVVGLVGFAIGLWVLIDLGLLKGTPGPNRYGPDPLAAKVQAAS